MSSCDVSPWVLDAHTVPVSGVDPENALQIMPPGAEHIDRAAWLMKRRTGCGASDVSSILGMSQYTASIDVWEDKTGRIPLLTDLDSEAAAWGLLLEPVVRDEYARRHGLTIDLVGMLRSQQWPWLLCDPDGLVIGAEEGYEGKTSSAFAKDWNTKEIADHAELQAQTCMAVTGYKRWHVACLVGGQRPVFHVIDRDDELIGDIVAATQQFWHDHVLADTPPPPDASVAYGKWLDRTHPTDDGGYVEIDPDTAAQFIREHTELDKLAKELDSRKQALTNHIKAIMGHAERLVVGNRTIATWATTERFAETKFRKAHPDLADEFTREHFAEYLATNELKAKYPQLYREFCSRPLNWK